MELSNLSFAAEELTADPRTWEKFGMVLTPEQVTLLAQCQADALRATGRVSFCGGVLKKLAEAFCDSPYIQPEDWADTLAQLVEIFYSLKNETRDRIGDDALIAAMAARFNGASGGSADALASAEPSWFLRFDAEGSAQ